MSIQNLSTFFRKPWPLTFFVLLLLAHIAQAAPETTRKKMACTSSTGPYTSTPSLPLPFNANQEISNTLNIDNDWGTMTHMSIIITELTHDDSVGSLTLSLSHDGTDVKLMDWPAPLEEEEGKSFCGKNIIALKLDDNSQFSVQKCSTGEPAFPYIVGNAASSYLPYEPLRVFYPQSIDSNVYGTWTLTVMNHDADHRGVLKGWCLEYEREFVVSYSSENFPDALSKEVKSKQFSSGVSYESFSIMNDFRFISRPPAFQEALMVETTITGEDAGALSWVKGGGTTWIKPNETASYQLKCTPTHLGPHRALLTIRTNDPNPDYQKIEYPFSTCVGVQAFQSSPPPGATFELGSTELNQVTPTQTLEIREISGLENLNVFGKLSGPYAKDFFISPSSQILTPGGQGSLTIGCKPTTIGKRTASLTLSVSDFSVNGGKPTYFLGCEGLSSQYLSNPSPGQAIKLGTGQAGSSLIKTFKVANSGNKDLLVEADTTPFVGSGAKVFSLSKTSWTISPTQSPQDPMKEAVELEIKCTLPQEATTYTAELKLKTNDPNSLSVSYPISCRSIAAGYGSTPPPSRLIDFGYVPSAMSKPLKVREIGEAPLSLTNYQIEGPDQADFSLISPVFPFEIPGDAIYEVDLMIQCAPKDEPVGAGRMREARLTLHTNATNFPSPSYDLKCQGPKAKYDANLMPQNALDFAKVKLGQIEQRSLPIKSIGDSSLIIELLDSGLSGEHAKDFNLETSFPIEIPARDSKEIIITCKPTAPGERKATVNLKSNDLDFPTLTYALTCSGWTDPPPPPPSQDPQTAVPPSNQPQATLIVSLEGTGRGQVKSTPVGIHCSTGDKDCQFVYDLSTEVLLTAEAEPGSSFIRWSGPEDCRDGKVLIDVNKWCIAHFAQVMHVLTVTHVGSGYFTSSVSGLKCNQDQCTQEVAEGTGVTLTAISAPGWQFKTWEGACDSQGQVTMTSDKSCQATFVQKISSEEVLLTVEKTGPGKGTISSQAENKIFCGEICTQIYQRQATEILTALPATGSVFVDWAGDCQGTKNSVKVVLDQVRRCQAHFELAETLPYAHHSLTLSVIGLGKGVVTKEVGQCTAPCYLPVYPAGTNVLLTAQAEKDSEFKGWEGDCTGLTPQFTVVMNKDISCMAHFDLLKAPLEPQTYPLRVVKEGDGEASVISSPDGINITPTCNCSEMTVSYASGTTVMLAAIPSLGSKFMGFSGDSACYTGKVLLDKPVTCVATFVKETITTPTTPPKELPPREVSSLTPSQGMPLCPTEGLVNVICNYEYKWQLKDITVGEKGNISSLELEGTIYSQGWISNATLQPGTTLTGGVITGYINSQGVIKDVEFRGATLVGGTLAGKIVSEDRFGTIRDVKLAPDTYLVGGELGGTIVGDANHPALLENVILAEGTSLSHLVIGKGVKFKGEVNLGPGVIVIDPSTPKEDLSKFINYETDAQGQTLKEITVGEAGKVSNVVLEGRILNQGIIADATFQEGSHTLGGILTGQITNHGTLANIEFQGDSLTGGYLAGTIRNIGGGTLQNVELSSETHLIGGQLAGEVIGHGARLDQVVIQGQVEDVIIGQDVKNEGTLQDIEFQGQLLTGGNFSGQITNTQGGTLEDIHLEPGTSLTGGNLRGNIIGEAEDPARLDHVTIVGGSYLEYVILGEDVTVPKSVTFGPGVQSLHPLPPEDEQPAQELIPLAIGIDATGKIITSQTTFTYELTASGTPYPSGAMLSSQVAQEVDLSAIVTLGTDHVGQAADILVVSIYKAAPTVPPETYLKVGNKWTPWDYDLAKLEPASFSQALPEKLKVPVFKKDDLSATTGEYTVLVGYRLEDGTIIYNGRNPFYFFIDGAPKTCVLYAVQDEKLNDTQLLKIDLSRSLWGTMQAFGPLRPGRDIEGLTLHPKNANLLYATSGDDANVEGQHLDGYLYTIDRKTAELTLIGPTGFSQVAALGTDPIKGDLWGWAEIKEGNKRQWSGLIKIDPTTGEGKPIKQFDPQNTMGGLAVSPDGNKIYTSSGGTLWVYDKESQEMQKACDHITKGRIEGLDMQPNGILLLGIDLNQTTTLTAYDPQTCEVVKTRTYHEVNYDDIESIVWPATECNDQSWLSRDSQE